MISSCCGNSGSRLTPALAGSAASPSASFGASGGAASIWPGVVIRSDTTPIRIGNNVHIEENSVLHTSTHIEDNLMIGHGCCIEAFIGHDTMIGSTASLMPMSRIGAFCAVAAGSTVLDQAVMPDNAFITGSPAKVHSMIDPANPKHAMRLART